MNKNIDNSPLTDYNYEEVLDRSFKNVTNNAIKSTPKKEVEIDVDFMKASENFWLTYEGGKYFPIYNEGVLGGTYNTRQPTFRAISETLLESFRNILRIQCEKEDKTVEEFASYLDIIHKTFNLISDKMDSTLDERISGELIMSYLHATFNSFINTNIKRKG